MSKLELTAIEKLIREEKDPAALQAKLAAMIEEAHPAPAFEDGETMPYYEFEQRFKKAFCGNVEPRLQQHQVRVILHPQSGLLLELFPLMLVEFASDRTPEAKDGNAL